MMATIESRLIHLLNDADPPDLPPIQLLPFGGSSGHAVSLPPLEPDTGTRSDKTAPKHIPPFYTLADDPASRQAGRAELLYSKENINRPIKSIHPLQLLLVDPEANGSSHSLRMILDDPLETAEDPSTKKRHRALTVKDDFVQLPQPLKKQKSTQQVVPPIIQGLHEPPPDAAVFPPISSGSFDESEAPNLNILKDLNTSVVEDRPSLAPAADADKSNGAKSKRRAAKPRRKWTEEETNHLLLGVSRHGVGKWTSILEDPDYVFNDRTAGDLKDRFRTCCPDELRSHSGRPLGEESIPLDASSVTRIKPKTGLLHENILIEPEEVVDIEKGRSSSQPDSDAIPKQKRSRAHRKKMEDLVELGIHGPFKKSHRRERRPFTEHDDREILEGLEQYGPAWTKIQRDPKYNLSTRQPTDLRDRVRNKYPEIYARIEKGNLQVKESGRNNLLEPSVSTTIESSFHSSKTGPLEPQLNRTSSKEDMPKWPIPSGLLDSSDAFSGASAFDICETSASAFVGSVGEMDISRLLLDDSQVSGF